MTRPGPGKFEGNESEEVADFLYEITLNGGCVEQFGDVMDYGLWEGLIESLEGEKTLDAAAYIVREDSNGFFTYDDYDSFHQAKDQFEKDRSEYVIWNTVNDLY